VLASITQHAFVQIPGLAVVLVGERRDSATYVRMKTKACEEVGISSMQHTLPSDTSQQVLLDMVAKLNADDSVHGILVQLPLPDHIDEHAVLESIKVSKDVDGLHPTNMAYLAMRGREPLFAPCTPSGCIELLKRYNIPIRGKRAVVLGRSNIVGIPAGLLLMANDATVTMCHRYTADLKAVLQEADIVLVAIGKAEHVPGDWIKPGATVIDVGINSVDDSTAKRGYRLVGDVHYESASKVAGAITPVPGGVGPMTIAMLLRNTVDSAVRAYGLQE
jgi:5,10-methylene-tetrahydrofolate dehydrogenase/methenyl tetrahydrofolate cyclohydrolase